MVDDRANDFFLVLFTLFLRENVPVSFESELLEDVFGDLFGHAFFVSFFGERVGVGGIGFALLRVQKIVVVVFAQSGGILGVFSRPFRRFRLRFRSLFLSFQIRGVLKIFKGGNVHVHDLIFVGIRVVVMMIHGGLRCFLGGLNCTFGV